MAVWWTDFVSGVSGAAGAYATPKLQPADWNSLGTAGDEWRVKATHAAPTNSGTATWTNGTASISFAANPSLQQYDLVSMDLVNWYPVASQSGSGPYTVTFYTGNNFAGTTGAYTTYLLRPVDLTARTNANMTWAMNTGLPLARNIISGGWDSETTQNGYTCYRTTTNSMTLGSSLHYATINKFFFARGGYGLNLQITSGLIISNCDFAQGITGELNIGGSSCAQITGCRFHGTEGANVLNFSGAKNVLISGNAFRVSASNGALNLVLAADVIADNNTFVLSNTSVSIVVSSAGITRKVTFSNNTITRASVSQALTQIVTGTAATTILLKNQAIPAWVTGGYAGATTILSPGHRCRIDKYNQVAGDHRTAIGGFGTIIRVTGDGSITPPTGFDAAEYLVDRSSGAYVGTKAASGSSVYTCQGHIKEYAQELYLTTAVTHVRLNVNAVGALTAAESWLELEKADGTVVQSTDAISARSAINDWSQWHTIGPLSLSAAQTVKVNYFLAKYHASNKTYIARLQYSVDSGSTWIDCDQLWEDGEIAWRMPANSPIVATVIPTTVYGRYNELSGAADLPAISSVLDTDTLLGVQGTFIETDRNTDPGEANVLTGTNYKILNVAKTGSLTLSYIRSVSPTTGNIAGGTTVTALVNNGGNTAGTIDIGDSVNGWHSCTIVSWSNAIVKFTTPAHAAGLQDLRFTPSGGSADIFEDGFTYVASSTTDAKLTDILENIETLIEGITPDNGYAYSWGTCTIGPSDAAHKTYPDAEIIVESETPIGQDSALQYYGYSEVMLAIRVRCVNDANAVNPLISIENEYADKLRDLKDRLGENLGVLALDGDPVIQYEGHEREISHAGDVFTPGLMTVRFKVKYQNG